VLRKDGQEHWSKPSVQRQQGTHHTCPAAVFLCASTRPLIALLRWLTADPNQFKKNYRKAKRSKIKAHKLQNKKNGIRKLSSTNAPENRVNKKHVKKMAKRAKLFQPKAAIGANLVGGVAPMS